MRSKEQIEATIETIEKLNGLDSVKLANLRKDYGEHFAAVFDELRDLRVVSSPDNDGVVSINKNYLGSALAHYKAILDDYNRAEATDRRAKTAINISKLGLGISVLGLILSVIALLSKIQ